MPEVELMLKTKNRKVWLVGFLWMIISGIIFYFILGFVRVNNVPAIGLTYLILFLLTFVVLTVTGVVLKSPMLSWRNSLVFPFGIVISVLLNAIAPQWSYLQDTIGFAIGNFLLLLVLYFLAGLFAFPLVRICTGYEVAPQFEGKAHSFIFSCQEDIPSLLKELFSPFDISINIYPEKNYALFEFTKKRLHRFLAYWQRRNEVLTELDLLAYRISRDIIIDEENGELETFFAALDGIVNKWKEQGKEIAPEPNPKFIENARDLLLIKYTTPIKFEINFSRIKLFVETWKDFPKKHPYAFSTILTILSALLSALITKTLVG